MRKNRKIYFSISVILGLSMATNVFANSFDPNNIISDSEMLNSTSMTLSDIDQFLKNKGGYISKNRFPNFEGKLKTAAEIIYDASVNNYDCSEVDNIDDQPTQREKELYCNKITMNPKVLLVLLQKEQSLIEDKNPEQGQLNWATGYGCPDGGGCNDRWKGFGKQVNSAALQFYDYLENPHDYPYVAGNLYRVSNTGKPDSMIRPETQATAALYNYTPHVYNGNFNFYNLYQRYFSLSYPNRSLLQAKGEGGIWLIDNGKKRPFISKGALTSRFDLNKVIQVDKSVLDSYPTGTAIKYPQYSLLRSPNGGVFLLVDDKRRGFTSTEALRKVGINPEEIIDASWEDILAYEEGIPITASSSFPTGALLQDKTTGGVYYVSEGTKAPLWDAVLLKTKFKNKSITPVDSEKLAAYTTVEPAIFGDGELLKSSNSRGVYIIDNKKRRPITSGEIFEKMGYKWENIITVPEKILNLYEEGEALSLYQEDSSETTNNASGTELNEGLQDEINSILNPLN